MDMPIVVEPSMDDEESKAEVESTAPSSKMDSLNILSAQQTSSKEDPSKINSARPTGNTGEQLPQPSGMPSQ